MTRATDSRPTSLVARLIAFYLPQFHPIPENDEWWGKGFTEWTNTAKARPMFPGHYQPHVPADLGFYDLRNPETRAAQAELAREYGFEAFCYYHYWFAGRQILERPLQEVIRSGKPDFPFCVCWANSTWTGIWHGAPNRILIEQTYPGEVDHRAHFASLLPAFSDDRYVRVNGKPLFVIYEPLSIPDLRRFTDLWREMAHTAGLKGLQLVANHGDPLWDPRPFGFDASTNTTLPQLRPWISRRQILRWARSRYALIVGRPTIYRYEEAMDQIMPVQVSGFDNYPCLIHAWDNSPRSGKNGLVLHESTPELFRLLLRRALEVRRHVPREENLIFLKSWNEWAEGNHLEPDLKFGKGYLEVIKEEVLAACKVANVVQGANLAAEMVVSGSD
jgi:lipopolysaccharide biosynthesis protein